MSAMDATSLEKRRETLENLSSVLHEKTHLLALGGNEEISKAALDVTKVLFDFGISLEPFSHAHIHPFLAQITEPPTPNLRQSTLEKKKSKQKSAPEAIAVPLTPQEILPFTPLSELTVVDMDGDQIWAQMELRAEGYAKVVKEIVAGSGAEVDEVDEEDEEGSEEEEEEEEMSEEEFRKMFGEGVTEEEIARMFKDTGSSESESEEGEDEDDSEVEGSEGEDEDEEMDDAEFERWVGKRGAAVGGESDEDEDEEGEDEDEDEDEDVSVGDEDASDAEASEEDGEDDLEEDGEEDLSMDEDEDEDDEDGAAVPASGSDSNDDLAIAGPSRQRQRQRRQHPTLDDSFFSIDEFNRLTEEAEAGKVSRGKLNADADDEDDDAEIEEDVSAFMLREASEDEPLMYGDFFAPPRYANGEKPVGNGRSKGKGKEEKPKAKKSKGKGVKFTSEDDEEEEDVQGEGARDVIGRFKEDLFDDEEDEEEQEEQNLSTHERRQLELAKQIAELEQQAIGPKDWTLLGEATARARPENSLLEENLDFEHTGKVVPVITEDTVKTLEEMIKKRILDNNFDSTVRVRAYEPTPFLPSRYFDLQDTQSNKSLAQIYEEEFQAAASGSKVADARDLKLNKDHEEIEKLWGEICYKLDALSSLNFVPKAPKASITTISNLPTTSLESALPASTSSTTLLAPEELFQPPTASTLVSRSELTPEEASRSRERSRKHKKAERKKLGDMAELYGKKKGGGPKAEKERALENLVKAGKGVTVVGKGEKEVAKTRKRGQEEVAKEDGKRLKL